MFELHPNLASGTQLLAQWKLCQLRALPDPQLPWLVLVPQREGVLELFDLSPADQGRLIQEVNLAALAIAQAFGPDKINLGALGNLTPQFHFHVIGRYKTDRGWPGPIWGVTATPDPTKTEQILRQLSAHFRG